MKYKVYKKFYHDKYGKVERTTFFVKKKKAFLGISYWKDVTHTECGYGDCYKTTTTFPSEEKAKEFIKDILCPEVPRQKWIETPIKEISCV